MKSGNSALAYLLATTLVFATATSLFAQTSASATAGFNLNAPPSQPPIEVPWDTSSNSWRLQVDLVFNPPSGPMGKHFFTPPITLVPSQPLPLVLWEDFLILPPTGTAGFPVTDWHEEIHTPGWVWVAPGNPNFPDLFPATATLITRNGQPWPSTPIPMDPVDPSKLWVEFEKIEPGNVLDVHKALLWRGTEDNTIWGDNILNDGTPFDERFIEVWEYPTGVPEPATVGLLGAALFAVLLKPRHK